MDTERQRREAKEAMDDQAMEYQRRREEMNATGDEEKARVVAELENTIRELQSELVTVREEQRATVAELERQREDAEEAEDSSPILSFDNMMNDPKLRAKVPQLTGCTSAASFQCFWNFVNHDGAADRMVMWQDPGPVKTDDNDSQTLAARQSSNAR